MPGFHRCIEDVPGDDRDCVLPEGHRGRHAVKPTYREILRIETTHTTGSIDHRLAIDATGLPAARYYRYLELMLQDPAALAIDAVTVHRLIRIRNESRARREARPVPIRSTTR